jgi:ABC-type branched-subunit amino acid transport system permease subunit
VPVLSLVGFDFSTQFRFYYLALGLLGACLVVARNVDHLRVGRSLRAVGADQESAETLGARAPTASRGGSGSTACTWPSAW